jgi:hypothetical protein
VSAAADVIALPNCQTALEMAGDSLPEEMAIEISDKSRRGLDFAQQLNYQRALAGNFEPNQPAGRRRPGEVHLPFLRAACSLEREEPTGSVVVKGSMASCLMTMV